MANHVGRGYALGCLLLERLLLDCVAEIAAFLLVILCQRLSTNAGATIKSERIHPLRGLASGWPHRRHVFALADGGVTRRQGEGVVRLQCDLQLHCHRRSLSPIHPKSDLMYSICTQSAKIIEQGILQAFVVIHGAFEGTSLFL